MFSSALKSFQSNISANYAIGSNPTSSCGAWKVFDGKKKSTGKAVSVFVFDRKSLEPHSGGLGGRSGAAGLRKLHEEVIARIKKECNLLARLRHPCILELAEPIEETRNGLTFATEPVSASLAGLLQDKDDQERAGGVAGRPSRFVVEDADGQKRRRELEIDELEIQKGLLQLAQGLEFLHESAGLVHGNLTPEAIYVNVKSDWKIAGFGFAGPPDNSNSQNTLAPISLSEVLYHDPRLPRSLQLNLDYTSPDFALDSNISPSADMFSLGLLLLALYHSPHTSPIKANANLSTYKKLFSSSSSVPSSSNNFLSSRPLPKDLASAVLPRLITRRPAQRMTAREFQQSRFFDNILVSSIRFLDALPAKTPNEKSQFMRGLPRILNDFPKSVLDKKVLPALLEETKDRELLFLILQNVFKIIKILPSAQRVFPEKVIPQLRDIFLSSVGKAGPADRDTAKEAGLVVVLENMDMIADNCSGKEFKENILPIIQLGLESPTHSIVDKSLSCLPTILSVLDFSTIKNEVFPVVAAVFSKTSSLGIKIRGLEAFVILCGGSSQESVELGDGLDGAMTAPKPAKPNSSAILDKYTVQEKVVPLLRAMKTKEPAVMMAALAVFKQVGKLADTDFLASDVLPILWSFSLGPLLNLQQFQEFMNLIKSLSAKIEREQTRKLQDLSSSNGSGLSAASRSNDLMNMGSVDAMFGQNGTDDVGESDFERLVLGKGAANGPASDILGESMRPQAPRVQSGQTQAPVFSWSTPAINPTPNSTSNSYSNQGSRAITPDQSMSAFNTLQPLSAGGSKPMQPMQPMQPNGYGMNSLATVQPSTPVTPWPNFYNTTSTLQSAQPQSHSSVAPSSQRTPNAFSTFSIAPPPSQAQRANPVQQYSVSSGPNTGPGMNPPPANSMQQTQKKGLDAYESLI